MNPADSFAWRMRTACRPFRRMGCGWWLLFALLAAPLSAHQAYLTSALARIKRDGSCVVEVRFDALAFALNDTSERVADEAMNQLLDGPADELDRRMAVARTHFLRHFHLYADGRELTVDRLDFPAPDEVRAWKAAGHEPRLPVLLNAVVTARLPTEVRNLGFSFPEIIGMIVLTVERPGEEAWTAPVEPGATSPQLAVNLAAPTVVVAATPAAEGVFTRIGRFVRLGFEHILPAGLDHVLFVLGLFLLNGRLSALLWQVTAFTLAHSVTLALALYGIVRVSADIVEPLIALSIVLVAADNLRARRLPWWRIAVVFCFGLVHGLGFAGALVDLGLPRPQFLQALVGFNLGVELGQLSVIGLAFLAVGWWRSHRAYQRVVVVPASAAIAAVALFWTVQRLWPVG